VQPARQPRIRAAISDLFVDLEALRLLAYRVGWTQHEGEAKPYQAAIAKMFGCELQHRIYELGMQVLGPQGLIESWHTANTGAALLTHEWLESFGQTIAGGTTEIQRNLIARGIGLPRAS
jgi:alkylation response protein AidB-like acyl-CoA dehydrogenase